MPVLLVPPRPAHPRRWGFRLCSVLGGGFSLWAAWFIWQSSVVGFDGVRRFCLFDDAMIAMRYGWNLAHGAGAVWNAGELPRVEGYANPLAVALMAIAARLCSPDRSAAVLVVQLAGIPLALLNAWTLRLIAREALLPSPVGEDAERRENGARRQPDTQTLETLAFAAALTFYPLLYWTLLGMETGPLALLLSASVLLTLKYARSPRPALGLGLVSTLALAYLARPDAVIFAGLAFGYLLLCGNFFPARSRRQERKRTWKSFLDLTALALAYGLVLVVHLLWRHAYYGQWVPNTYVLKMAGFPLKFRLVNGLHYLAPFLVACRWLGLIIMAGLLLDFRREKLFLAVFPLTMAAYQIYVGGDPWDLWRQVAPTVPLALLLVAHELLRLTQALVPGVAEPVSVDREGSGLRDYFTGRGAVVPASALAPLLATGALGALVLVPLNAPYRREILGISPPIYTDGNAYDVDVGVALREVTTPEATVGAAALGAIAYYSERPSVDLLGKCDLRVAQLAPDLSGAVSWNRMKSIPGHNKYDFAYSIEELQPSYVQLFRWGRQDVSVWAREHYVQAQFHGVTLPLRRGSPAVRWERLDTVGPLASVKTEGQLR